MNIKVIGSGAAGNKALIEAIEGSVIDQKDTMLINSTDSDLPSDWRDKAYILSEESYGCAKEANTAEELTINAIDKGMIPFKQFCDGADEIIIVGSCMGGTGTGSIPVIADHISNQLGHTVRIIPFIGFGADETELRNVVGFFTKLSEDYIIEEICNDKFLKEARGNFIAAEKLANGEFIQKLVLLQGKQIIESEQNIDRADLLKVNKTSGHAYTLFSEFDRLKNVDEYNEMINKMIDNSKSFDIINGTQRRMAIIFNIPNTPPECIDFNHKMLRERLGNNVKDIYYHVQTDGKIDDDNKNTKPAKDFIAVLSTGSLFPKEAIDKYYNKFKEAKSAKKEDTFFAGNSYDLDDDDNDGSVYDKKKTSQSKFFNKKFNQTTASKSEVAATQTKMI